ncbi:MAG: MarR family transcriptional regulator [Desulfobacterales bacterium]
MDSNIKNIDEIISSEQICKDILVSLRKIVQAIDIHSKNLNRRFGITAPQLLILQEISDHEQITVTKLADIVSLKQTTVTDIINRLERKGLVQKSKDDHDKRRSFITLTEESVRILENTPSHLQAVFVERFSRLSAWEKLMLLSAMKRMVDLMSAEKFHAAPLLATGSVVDSA